VDSEVTPSFGAVRVMPEPARSDIRMSLLTGGDDPMYSIPLATALAEAGIHVDFVGNDSMEKSFSLKRANIRYLNLRGSQDPAAPLHSRITRVLR
jgi:hypothetical protein